MTQPLKRLLNEVQILKKDPPDLITACPLENNMFEWRYCLQGPPDTAYAGGEYHGKLIFPPNYPFSPPSILMITPNGRFSPNSRICLSISDFHPETWNPGWNIGTILTGLLSFMVEETHSAGCIKTSDAQKKKFASESKAFNRQDVVFKELFVTPIASTSTTITTTSSNQLQSSSKSNLQSIPSKTTPCTSSIINSKNTNTNGNRVKKKRKLDQVIEILDDSDIEEIILQKPIQVDDQKNVKSSTF